MRPKIVSVSALSLPHHQEDVILNMAWCSVIRFFPSVAPSKRHNDRGVQGGAILTKSHN